MPAPSVPYTPVSSAAEHTARMPALSFNPSHSLARPQLSMPQLPGPVQSHLQLLPGMPQLPFPRPGQHKQQYLGMPQLPTAISAQQQQQQQQLSMPQLPAPGSTGSQPQLSAPQQAATCTQQPPAVQQLMLSGSCRPLSLAQQGQVCSTKSPEQQQGQPMGPGAGATTPVLLSLKRSLPVAMAGGHQLQPAGRQEQQQLSLPAAIPPSQSSSAVPCASSSYRAWSQQSMPPTWPHRQPAQQARVQDWFALKHLLRQLAGPQASAQQPSRPAPVQPRQAWQPADDAFGPPAQPHAASLRVSASPDGTASRVQQLPQHVCWTCSGAIAALPGEPAAMWRCAHAASHA